LLKSSPLIASLLAGFFLPDHSITNQQFHYEYFIFGEFGNTIYEDYSQSKRMATATQYKLLK
jgi:hypothetical protein